MAYTQNDNSGSLFRNDRRTTDSHPHAKGKALIGGVWYWVSAWTKEPRQGGDKYQSLSFQEMTPEQVQQYAGGGNGQQATPQRQQQAPQRQPARQSAPSQRPGSPFDGEPPSFENSEIPFGWQGRNAQPL